jgi:hypothetical protein
MDQAARPGRILASCGLACTSANYRPLQVLGPAALGHEGGDLVNRGVNRDTPILGPPVPAEPFEEPLPIRAIVEQAVGVDTDHVALPPAEPVRERWLGKGTRLGAAVMDRVVIAPS